jgi:GrpB-like predicted nucleotidyltransferase (UPF0157 family)
MSEAIGLKKGMVKLDEFSTLWAGYFQLEQALLTALFGHHIKTIAHIGSTAIPGLKAKPIIDILLVLQDGCPLEEAAILLAGVGYEKGQFLQEEGVFLIKGSEDVHSHYLHLRHPAHAWQKYIVFRDYLVRHPEKALEYESLKANLGHTHATNRELYTRGKDAFIRSILALAFEESK